MCSNCSGDYEDPELTNPDYVHEEAGTKYGVGDTLAMDTGGLRKPKVPITWRVYAKALGIFVLAFVGTILAMIALLTWFGGCARADELPEAPRAKAYVSPKPVRHQHFDTGWWTRAHAAAAGFDGITSRDRGESNPVVRPFIGSPVKLWRESIFGTLEVVGVSVIPNKKVRRTVQIGLIVAHVVCGVRNQRNR